jgi:murein DD-endopeptidase MepM/ murein hydrolase activator NlpD
MFLLIFILTGCLSTQAPAPIVTYKVGMGAGTTGIHTVLKGDTLYSISQRYNIASRDIAVVNNLQAPFYLPPGLRLRMPPPQEYGVREGDNLNSVSRLFGVPPSEIVKMNNLRPPYTLAMGQSLRLPSVTQKSEPQAFAKATSSAPYAIAAPVDDAISVEPLAPPPSALPPVKYSPLPKMQEKPVELAAAKVAGESLPAAKPISKNAMPPIPGRASTKFMKPVKGKVISGYGPKQGGLFNDGVNIAAPRDVPVRAAENGIVVYSGNQLKGSGNLVLIKHADRWMTAYGHLGNIQIKRGDVVKRGQTIGTVGSSGSVDSPQLHFELRRGREALNPEVYLEG